MYSKELWNDLYIDYYSHDKVDVVPWMDDSCKINEFNLLEEIISPMLRNNSRGLTLLDYGCGNGHMGSSFSGKGVKVDLADISNVLVEKLKHEYGNDLNVSVFNTTTPNDLPKGKKYDVIIVRNVFHHLNPEKDWPLFLEMFSERLKPDGLLLISGFDKDDEILKQKHSIASTGQKLWCINDLPNYINAFSLVIDVNITLEIEDPKFNLKRKFRFFTFKNKHNHTINTIQK